MTPEIGFGIGVLVVLAAIAYGLWQSRKMSPESRRRSEDATHNLYKDQKH